MFPEIWLLHRVGSQAFEPLVPAGNLYFWDTCLRQIAFGSREDIERLPRLDGDEILQGLDAYGRCLEIASGLHSPLIGETEVLGQFKNACRRFAIPKNPWGTQFQRFIRSTFADVKKIRLACLDNLGSQSYGSVVRRELKGLTALHVIGAGQLACAMLPWLAKNAEGDIGGAKVDVRIHARDPARARQRLASTSNLAAVEASVTDLNDFSWLAQAEAVVVAAPVSAAWLCNYLQPAVLAGGRLRTIVDLRADSALDRLDTEALGARVITLPQVMASIGSNQERILERKAEALAQIASLVFERGLHVEYRPFGWEDVCA